jgi:hypothetical protein
MLLYSMVFMRHSIEIVKGRKGEIDEMRNMG